MKYKILLHVEVNARDDHQAVDLAHKLGELLKNPMVKMALEGEGIRPVSDPVVYMPQRNGF